MIRRRDTDAKKNTRGMGQQRDAGVLMHITSLPGPYGIGDLGPAAYVWVDALAQARQRWWQILPLGPTDQSPYNAFSAFAGNPKLLSPDMLLRDGLLQRDHVRTAAFPAGRANYRRVAKFKAELLASAWARFRAGAARQLRASFERFCAEKADWLDDYALFMALKEATGGGPWAEWPRELVFRKPAALRQARSELADAVDRHRFAQFLFDRQWTDLRRHARRRGVGLIGDLPIFVSAESSDVWARPELFQLDRDRRPTVVAGVPPDYFSRAGQRWGNPLYNWKAMRQEGYAWWIARLRCILARVDIVRIDHFRGFEAYWEVPAQAPTARKGRWVKAPGMDLFRTVEQALGGLPFIAEDLGVITPEVEAMRDELGLPGMRVLQFAFGGDATSPHLPHNHVCNSVVYTGTHDNDTTAGWFRSLDGRGRKHLRQYAPHAEEDVPWALIRLAWGSVANHAIVPLQDVLGLGSAARMNVPGKAEGNWRWRLKEKSLSDEHLGRLAEMTAVFGRARVANGQLSARRATTGKSTTPSSN